MSAHSLNALKRTHTHAQTSAPKPSCLLLSMASFEDVASEFRCLSRSRAEQREKGQKTVPKLISIPRTYHRPRSQRCSALQIHLLAWRQPL